MTLEQLGEMLFSCEFDKVSTNLPEVTFFCHKENNSVNAVCVIDYRGKFCISDEQYAGLKQGIIKYFYEQAEWDVHILSLIVTEDLEKAKRLCVRDRFCWVIDAVTDRLLIYEEQVPDFYGMRNMLEDFLFHLQKDAFSPKKWDKEARCGMPWVTILLVAINVIVFLICTFTGELLYNIGAVDLADIMEDGGYYRIITSMFLHAGVGHLFSNMLVLYYVGELVEKRMGHLPYAVIYFLSGIAGNMLYLAYEFVFSHYGSSVGASGAVFGVEGALLLLVIMNKGSAEYKIIARRLPFAIAFSLYCGFTESNTNNAAHIGGVLTGFATAGILWMGSWRIRGKDRNMYEG